MAKLLQTLIPLLSSIALLLLAAANTARSQTTEFDYNFYGFQPLKDIIYQGDAHYPSDPSYLHLTKTNDSGAALPHSAGRVVYSKPIQFWQPGAEVDLETTIKFTINPNSGNQDPADGFTFFIEPVGSSVGFSGASFGIFDEGGSRPSVFAVEFDIYPNPGVDPSYRHIGIDIESNVSKNVTEVDDALLGQEVTARINYEEATKVISVHVSAGSKTYEAHYVYPLNTILTQQVQVGISASTGGQVAVHELSYWHFRATLVHKFADNNINIKQVV